jgi:branched-chain amino acid transport system permease protein
MTQARSPAAGFTITAALALVCVALPLVGLPLFYVQQAFLLFFFSALAQSWNILGGYGGYLSFGHVAFVGLGGYTVGILYYKLGLSPFITFPLAGVTSSILALIIGAICFRIRGSYFLIATMLVLFILQSLALNLRDLTNGSNGIDLPLFTNDYRFEARLWYYCGFGALVVTSLVAYAVERSTFGLNLNAIREDEDVARTMGVRTVQVKAAAFMLSAALAGMLGAMYTYRAHVIEPIGGFSIEVSAAPILMAILGGSRTWVGPIIGAVIFQTISIGLAVSFGNEYSNVVFSLFLIVVVLLLPEGLVGLAKRSRKPAVAPASAPAAAAETAKVG